jgi:hypothetical protein
MRLPEPAATIMAVLFTQRVCLMDKFTKER